MYREWRCPSGTDLYQFNTVLAGEGIGGLALAMATEDTLENICGGITVLTDNHSP